MKDFLTILFQETEMLTSKSEKLKIKRDPDFRIAVYAIY
jgi:hypothetical protein